MMGQITSKTCQVSCTVYTRAWKDLLIGGQEQGQKPRPYIETCSRDGLVPCIWSLIGCFPLVMVVGTSCTNSTHKGPEQFR